MKAVKKPIPITVEVFDPHKKPWPRNVQEDRSGLGGVEYFVWNALSGEKRSIEPGDYVNVTDDSDTYPIKRQVFEATYDIVR